MKSQIITPWIGTGASVNDANRPLVADDYTILKWTDVTGQDAANLQPDPNLYIIEVQADESVITAIEADNTYQVLWSE